MPRATRCSPRSQMAGSEAWMPEPRGPVIAGSPFAQLCADTRFYHQLKHPGRAAHVPALLLTFVTSRGLWSLAFHRIAYYSTVRRNLRNPLWWIARLLESVGIYLDAVINRSRIAGDCA